MEEVDFGFLFCRLMHFYAMSYKDLLALPIRSFWLLNGNIERISAQKDMRALTVGACAMSGEGAKEYRKQLILEVGEVYKLSKESPIIDAVRDEAGFAELKALAAM